MPKPKYLTCRVCGCMFAPKLMESHETKCIAHLVKTNTRSRPSITSTSSHQSRSANSSPKKSRPGTVNLEEAKALKGSKTGRVGNWQKKNYKNDPYFHEATYKNDPYFHEATYKNDPYFYEATSGSSSLPNRSGPMPVRSMSKDRARSSSSRSPNPSRRTTSDTPSTMGRRSSSVNRPGTTTLSTTASPVGRSASDLGNPESQKPMPNILGARMCYICGQRFSKNSLDLHEKKCLNFWNVQVTGLPKHIKVNQPQKMDIPSVDGSSDNDYLDSYAVKSSKSCQSVICGRCQGTIALVDVRDHIPLCRNTTRAESRRVNKKKQSNGHNPWSSGAADVYVI